MSLVRRILARMAALYASAAHLKATGRQPAVHSLSNEARARFSRQQLDGVFAHVANAAFISGVLAVALSIYLAPMYGTLAARCWLVAKLGVSAARLGVAIVYKRTDTFSGQDLLAKRWMLTLLVLDGAVWGFAGAWTVLGSAQTACLVAAVLASVALMASSGLGTMAAAGAAVNIPMLASVASAIAFRGDTIGWFGSAGITLVLVQCLITGRVSERRLLREYLAHEATADALDVAARNAEALEAALLDVKKQSAVKALFLGTMSHELRTPLHGILGLTELVRARSLDSVARHRLALIESSGNHLLELIGSLLDISRIDSGRLELHESAFDLAGELRNIAELYQLRSESKGLGFKAVVELEEPHMVLGDAARLRQVLHNLLGNAVKFTKTGLIILRVQRDADHRYTFDVRDTGPGIAPKDLGHIFEAFRQVDDSATRPADGTGLGLTIARELAHAMGGDIVVSSAVGVGSRFQFTARLADAPSAPEAPQKPSAELPQLRKGYRVLLVEDNEVNALIATANLEAVGAEVVRAADGREAISMAFGERRPDFILMDCRMPVMDGPTAAREIRTVEKATRVDHLPIIALTASPSEEDKRECYNAGMDGILMKPFTSQQLVQTISVYAAGGVCNADHPLYEFARSLEDMEPDLFGGPGLH